MTVVDASVAVKWFIQEANTTAAVALLAAGEVVAPELVVAEILNAAWRNVRLGRIGADEMKAIATGPPERYFTRLFTLVPLACAAAEIALSLDHPVYDCFYLALAKRERCELVTADERLYRRTRRTPFSGTVRKLA